MVTCILERFETYSPGLYSVTFILPFSFIERKTPFLCLLNPGIFLSQNTQDWGECYDTVYTASYRAVATTGSRP